MPRRSLLLLVRWSLGIRRLRILMILLLLLLVVVVLLLVSWWGPNALQEERGFTVGGWSKAREVGKCKADLFGSFLFHLVCPRG